MKIMPGKNNRKYYDLTDDKFGNLKVLEKSGRINRQITWKCICDCGNETIVRSRSLRDGTSTSCGCRMSFKPTIDQRFFSKFDKCEGCWEWKGIIAKVGYGIFSIKGKPIYAHRYSYEKFKGKIPKGMLICHTCDNPKCINPDHLFTGTYQDNTDDMIEKKRSRNLRGSDCPHSKLNEKIVLKLREDYSKGKSIKDMAIEFHVSVSAITHAVKKIKWRHV